MGGMDWAGMANTVKEGASGIGLGMIGDALGLNNDRKRLRRQVSASKELADYNKKLAIDTWNETNVGAQTQHMRDAGLGIGLMYGGSGGSGTATSAPASVSAPNGGSEATTGMAMALNNQLVKAQKENIEADTEKKKVETAKTGGVDTENVTANTKSVLQGIEATKATIDKVMAETDNAIEAKKGMEMDNELKERTMEANVDKVRTEVNAITEGLAQKWKDLELDAKKIEIDKFKAELEAQYPGTDKVSGKIINEFIMELNRKLGITNYENNKRKVGK